MSDGPSDARDGMDQGGLSISGHQKPKHKPSREQRLYDALKRIASVYGTPRKIRASAEFFGLSEEEHLEMAYENIQAEAKAAIKGMRRPR